MTNHSFGFENSRSADDCDGWYGAWKPCPADLCPRCGSAAVVTWLWASLDGSCGVRDYRCTGCEYSWCIDRGLVPLLRQRLGSFWRRLRRVDRGGGR